MPKKSKPYISDKFKTKGIFDHLRELTEGKDETYWSNLSGKERMEFSPYMVNRFLSMNVEWIDLIDDLQRYTIGFLPKSLVFEFYRDTLPKGKVFLKYVKGKGKADIPDALADMLMRYFKCSKKEMEEYFDILMRSEQGQQFIVELMQGYGTPEKELKKLRKEIGV